MFKLKLFILSFVIAFSLTALLCIAGGHPLIFLPIDYSLGSFISFAFLIGGLCFGLVFINFPLLKAIKKWFRINLADGLYYLPGTIIILQVVTVCIGYLESAFTINNGSWTYYYQGVGNSLIYILTGNLTAIIASIIFGKHEERLKKETKPEFTFEPNFR